MEDIVKQFLPNEEIGEIKAFGNGHINDTFGVKDAQGNLRWVLQKVNHHVFPRIEVLQHNVDVVSKKMGEKLREEGMADYERRFLYFYPLASDPSKNYTFDGEHYWRLCRYIPQSKSLSELTPQTARSAGEAFGRFEEILSDIPEGVLGDTIVNFHNMSFRLGELRDAVNRDAEGRYAKVKDLVNKLESRADKMVLQEQLYAQGKLPKRTIHCDTKVDNVLFDEDDHVLCVVDWDTVMPGFILSDVGDFIRTGVNTGAEDEADLDKIGVNMPVYKSFVEGYLSTAGKFLTPTERKLIAYGGRMMTYMQAVRFLTDYINGDTYYKVHDPEHNLRRAIAQFTYLERLEEKAPEMEAVLGV